MAAEALETVVEIVVDEDSVALDAEVVLVMILLTDRDKDSSAVATAIKIVSGLFKQVILLMSVL